DPKILEIGPIPKKETGFVLKPKQDVVFESATQIIHEQPRSEFSSNMNVIVLYLIYHETKLGMGVC
ncbi:hypothetical protein MKW92_021559, partial [Papaver armeniacum]